MLDSNDRFAQYHTVVQSQIVAAAHQDYSLYSDMLSQVELNQKAGRLTDLAPLARELAVRSLCSDEALLDLLTCFLALAGSLPKPASLGQDASLVAMMKDPDALFNEHFYKKAVKEEVKKLREDLRRQFEASLLASDWSRKLFGIDSRAGMADQFEAHASQYLPKLLDSMYKKRTPAPHADNT